VDRPVAQRHENLLYFGTCHAAFTGVFERGSTRVSSALVKLAIARFDSRVDLTRPIKPALECRKGCATCCTLRVTATAPEVLHVAHHVREALSPDVCARFVQRLVEADELTHGLDEAERVRLRRPCPCIENGACVIYIARPLACRGHASHSRRACAQAAAGRIDSVPHSVAHRDARGLVQNALQSAMRDAQLAWSSFELNRALRIALMRPDSERAWLSGEDVFGEAVARDVPAEEMAAVFDAIKGIG
jgi:hypothetical protein